MAAALDASRQTFDRWRYFEIAVAETVARTLIDTEKPRNLGKAARVILDEAEMVGLECRFKVKGQQGFRRYPRRRASREDQGRRTRGSPEPRSGARRAQSHISVSAHLIPGRS